MNFEKTIMRCPQRISFKKYDAVFYTAKNYNLKEILFEKVRFTDIDIRAWVKAAIFLGKCFLYHLDNYTKKNYNKRW